MPSNGVLAGPVLVAGLRTEYARTYRIANSESLARWANIINIGVPSDKLIEIYGYFLAAPHPEIWKRDEGIPTGAFGSQTFFCENFDWGKRIYWHENDREDDQTGSMLDQARMLGTNMGRLPVRVLFQLLLSAVNPRLLPYIPLAPDGASLFATTAGGSDRFGVPLGNLLTGSGVGTAEAIWTDIYAAINQFILMQDGQGEPLWDDGIIESGLTLAYGVANSKKFAEALQQSRPVIVVQNVAQTENVAASAASNLIEEGGFKIDRRATPRITTNDWFVFLNGTEKKSVFQQLRRGNREAWATFESSDFVKGTKQEYFQVDNRAGYGISLPYQSIMIDN